MTFKRNNSHHHLTPVRRATAAAAFLIWATTAMTGVNSEERQKEEVPSHYEHNNNVLEQVVTNSLKPLQQGTIIRHLQKQEAWDPFGDYWTEQDDPYTFAKAVSISRNGKCVAAVSYKTIYVKTVMPDGTLVSRGQFAPPDDRWGRSKTLGDGLALSSDCKYIGVLYEVQISNQLDAIHVAVFKHVGGTDWVQVGQEIVANNHDIFGVSLSDDGKRTIACNDPDYDPWDYDDEVDYSCQVYHLSGDSWAPLGQRLPRMAKLSGDGSIVGTEDAAFKLNESGPLPVWEEIKVDRGSQVPDKSLSTELSKDGAVIANGYFASTLGTVIVVQWDASSQSYKRMGDPIFGQRDANDSCGHRGSISLAADGMQIAVGCQKGTPQSFPTDGGYVMTLDYDKKSDKWNYVGSPEELSSKAEDGIEPDSVDMSGDGNLIIIGSSSENRARMYVRDGQPGGTFEDPSDVTVECGESTNSSVTGKAVATGTDQCPRVEITERDSLGWTGCGSTKTIKRKWKATDSCGNTKKAIQKIKIVDTTSPEITSQVDHIIARCGRVPKYTSKLTAIDSCEGKLDCSKFYFSDESVDINNVGQYQATVGVKDSCGNSAERTQSVVVASNVKGGGVLRRKVKLRTMTIKSYEFDFDRDNCPSALTDATSKRHKIFLKLKIRDCQGNYLPDDTLTKGKPQLHAIYKVTSDGLKRTSISDKNYSQNGDREMEYNLKKRKWEYMVNTTDLNGPGCYMAEFILLHLIRRGRILVPVYATANFVLN